jgi:hypothetical protein
MCPLMNEWVQEMWYIIRYYSVIKYKSNSLRQSRTLIARVWEVEKMGNVGQRIQTFSYKTNKFWRFNIKYGNYS